MTPIAALTSGGDAPGMNTAIRALVKAAARAGVEVFGVHSGYDGLIDGRASVLHPRDVDDIGSYGGTVLGSVRSARFRTPEGRAQAARWLNGRPLVVIGGNGSLAGAHALAVEHGVQVIGLPASIDNDIGCTGLAIGVDTALNTIVEAADRIADTARAHQRAFILEVMGRQCGYLAMAAAVAAGADACLYRESGRPADEVIAALTALLDRSFGGERPKRKVLVLKAEGVQIPTTALVDRLQEHLAVTRPGVDCRATVLGHVVRGGSPSYQDRMIAGRLAIGAIEALRAGATDEMIAWQPHTQGGTPTPDPSVRRFGLAQVLVETEALLDGTSAVTRRRVRMMEAYEGVLAV